MDSLANRDLRLSAFMCSSYIWALIISVNLYASVLLTVRLDSFIYLTFQSLLSRLSTRTPVNFLAQRPE